LYIYITHDVTICIVFPFNPTVMALTLSINIVSTFFPDDDDYFYDGELWDVIKKW